MRKMIGTEKLVTDEKYGVQIAPQFTRTGINKITDLAYFIRAVFALISH